MLYASELENNTIAVKSAKTVKSVKVLSFNAQCYYNSGFFGSQFWVDKKPILSLTNKIRN